PVRSARDDVDVGGIEEPRAGFAFRCGGDDLRICAEREVATRRLDEPAAAALRAARRTDRAFEIRGAVGPDGDLAAIAARVRIRADRGVADIGRLRICDRALAVEAAADLDRA